MSLEYVVKQRRKTFKQQPPVGHTGQIATTGPQNQRRSKNLHIVEEKESLVFYVGPDVAGARAPVQNLAEAAAATPHHLAFIK